MRYILKAYTISEFGNRKDAAGNPHQEDSIFPEMGKATPEDRLFVLCDGMGGHEAGEVASSTVCATLAKSIEKLNPEGAFTDDDFNRALDAAYDALDTKDIDTEKKPGTTMTMLKLHNGGCTIAHIGDSRVYQFRPGPDKDSTVIMFQTEDHSLVNDLLKVGELTPEEAKTFNRKNVITRAMQPGGERRCNADIFHTVDIRPGDWFYLCSDGMLEQADNDNLRFIFSNASFKTGEEKVAALLENSKFNDDNHSALVVQIVDVIDPLPVPQTIGGPQILEAIVEDDAPVMAPAAQAMTPGIGAKPMRPVNQAALTQKKENKKTMSWLIIAFLITALAIAIVLFFTTDIFKGKEKAKESDKEKIEQVDDQTPMDNSGAPGEIQGPSSTSTQTQTSPAPKKGERRPAAKPNNQKKQDAKPQKPADNSSNDDEAAAVAARKKKAQEISQTTTSGKRETAE